MSVLYTTVASGATVSPVFNAGYLEARKATQLAIWCPTVDVCSLRLQGSFDQTSANFRSVMDATSPPNRYAVGLNTGDFVVNLGDNVRGIPYLKIDLSAAQTDNRSFAIMGT